MSLEVFTRNSAIANRSRSTSYKRQTHNSSHI